MARDFTVTAYVRLLDSLEGAGYTFQPLSDFIRSPGGKVVILRHDVDRYPLNSLRTAQAEHGMGIGGTYFFRCKRGRFEEGIIRHINRLGHEIGYHYEDFSKLKVKSQKSGLFRIYDEAELASIAFQSFRENLKKLRKIVPVSNICMHGSPTSRFDSRFLWKYYDYRELAVTAEPYFDICFEDVLYLTDTGRRWDGASVSVRDRNTGLTVRDRNYFKEWKVQPRDGSLMNMTPLAGEFQKRYSYRSTYEIVSALKSGEIPQKIMITFHPQRWNDKILPWAEELLFQNIKNPIKYFINLIIANRALMTQKN